MMRPDPADQMELPLAGTTVRLLAEAALFWPDGATLFIADPHFGRSATFQRAGLPVPSGATGDDLARLSRALARTAARQLVVLGDFFHTASSRQQSVDASLAQWRRRHPDLELTLVLGNHDRHAGQPSDALRVTCVAEPHALGPFACRHHPLPDGAPEDAGFALAGHLHPVAVLRDRDGSSLRLPCFHVSPRQAVLPAFTTFAGGLAVAPSPGDHIVVVHEDALLEARLG